jgi:hypothetical protein
VQDRAVHHSIPLVNSCERLEHAPQVREVDGRADVVGLLAFLHLPHEDLLCVPVEFSPVCSGRHGGVQQLLRRAEANAVS